MPEYSQIKKHLNFHYAWVVLTCSMVLVLILATIRQSFGVFIGPLVADHGWSRGAVSVAYAILFVSAAASSLGLAPFCERSGSRRTLLLSVASFCAGVVLLGSTTTLWQLYLYYGLLCGGLTFLINIIIPVAVTRWFARGAGLGLGLIWASTGIGGMLGPVSLSWLIARAGWRNAFRLVGTIFGSVMLLAVYFFRGRPQDMKMHAYGEQESTDPPAGGIEATTTHSLTQGVEFSHIMRTPAFWHLNNIHFLGCAGHAVLLVHIVSIALLKGTPELKAAGILGTIYAVSTISRFCFPMLAEKLGGKKALSMAFVMQSIPIPFLFLASETWELYAVAFFFGLGLGGEMPCFPIINRQYWGLQAPLNTIYAWEMAGGLSGMALGGWLGGALYDFTGTYSLSIVTSFLFSAAGLAPIMALPRHSSGVILAKSAVIRRDH